DVAADPRVARQLHARAGAQRVALIVIEEESPFLRRLEIGEAAGYSALALDRLMGERDVHARLPQQRRLRHQLGTADEDAIDRQWEEHVGVAEGVVVEE